ncbi:acylphosphatase [Chelatococcus sp. SYSU_G07232]|uniref:acylphosphatase n=1 Tax=Chelatococcus albus TaxID=3047466 RepID=A0ABT7ACZ3_9HYPH|nr:acylphosphatase [Chelatococcus sp. SYSU_G07232]MDJ1157250.1 acylphosphatase [Chelatococcus sp. SYSU_G07232]
MAEDQSTIRVVVRGLVQGVGYRAWVAREAEWRGLDGWVRNRLDGSVEALFMGPASDVEAMIAACRRGPSAARVETVEREEAPPGGRVVTASGFVVRPTV